MFHDDQIGCERVERDHRVRENDRDFFNSHNSQQAVAKPFYYPLTL
jgi:hypothetical protein